jgi:hypothetical protein
MPYDFKTRKKQNRSPEALERHRLYMKEYNAAKAKKYQGLYGSRRTLMDILYAEHGCYVCGETDPFALTFHHINPSEKQFGVTATNLTHADFWDELEKCICLCHNCHNRIHRLDSKTGIIDRNRLSSLFQGTTA